MASLPQPKGCRAAPVAALSARVKAVAPDPPAPEGGAVKHGLPTPQIRSVR